MSNINYPSISILGSTGSVGQQAIEVAMQNGIRVNCISAYRNVDLVERQARAFCVRACAMADRDAAKELKRPALAAILPAEKGGFTCLVDTGANVDCNASQLVDFAHMGSDFMKEFYNIESPRVGLLSNGAEETKGNRLVKETHALLKAEADLNPGAVLKS